MREKLEDAEARDILGVAMGAGEDEIRAAYLERSQLWRVRRSAATGALREEVEREEERVRWALEVLLGEAPGDPEPRVNPGIRGGLSDSPFDSAQGSPEEGRDAAPAGSAASTPPASPTGSPDAADPRSRRGSSGGAGPGAIAGVLLLLCLLVAWLEFDPAMKQRLAGWRAGGLAGLFPTSQPSTDIVDNPEPAGTPMDDDGYTDEMPSPIPTDELAVADSGGAAAEATPEPIPTPEPTAEPTAEPADEASSPDDGAPPVAIDPTYAEVGDGNDEARQAIVGTLEGWVRAVREGDADAFADAYAPSVAPYFGKRAQPRDGIRQAMAGQLANYSVQRSLALSEVDISITAPDEAVVTYRKSWDFRSPSRRYAGAEKERLRMAQVEGTWKIAGETEVEIYWVKRGR